MTRGGGEIRTPVCMYTVPKVPLPILKNSIRRLLSSDSSELLGERDKGGMDLKGVIIFEVAGHSLKLTEALWWKEITEACDACDGWKNQRLKRFSAVGLCKQEQCGISRLPCFSTISQGWQGS